MNGFHLDFSSGANLGADSATIDTTHATVNSWTPNGGITQSANQMIDSPTNNFATLSPIGSVFYANGRNVLSNGNLKATSTIAVTSAISTMAVTAGKWYSEFTVVNNTNGGNQISAQLIRPTDFNPVYTYQRDGTISGSAS